MMKSKYLLILMFFCLPMSAFADIEDYAQQVKDEQAAKDGFVEDKAIDKGDKYDEDLQEEKGDTPPVGKAPTEDVGMDKGTKQSLIEPVSEDILADKGDPAPQGSRPDEDSQMDKGY